MRSVKTALVLVLVASLLAVPVAAQQTPSITAEPQGTDGDTVEIRDATIDRAGWVVIHPRAAGGGPDASTVLGATQIDSGENDNVDVQLDSELTENQSLYAMLHYDDPADGDFTFLSSGDPPVQVNNSTVVQDFYVVTVPGSAGNQLAQAEQRRIEEQRRSEELEERQQQEQEEREELEEDIERLREQLNNTSDSDGDGGGNGLPGFGVLVAVAALVAAVLLIRRR